MITFLKDESELDSLLRMGCDSLDNHIIITDLEGTIIYANAAAQKITGYSFVEMKGCTPRLWGKQMSPQFYQMLWKTIKEEKKSFKGEVFNCRKNGEKYTAIATISPIVDKKGSLRGFMGIEEDISEIKKSQSIIIEKSKQTDKVLEQMKKQSETLERGRLAVLNILEDEKQLEDDLKKEKEGVELKVIERTEELANEKARLMAAISSLPHAFLIINNQCELVLHNSRLTPILGKPDGVWTFQKVNDSLGTEFNLANYVHEVIQGKKEMRQKEILVGRKYLKIFGSPILPEKLTDTNIILGSIITISDVTETSLLTRSRDEFFSIASHELRTPLTAIRGNTSMILDYYAKDLVNPDLKVMITDTHDASIRLIGIVNDFLDMSRLEMGKMEFKNEQLILNKVAKKIIADIDFNASQQGVTILNTIDEKISVWADFGKVEEILLNLVGNALKFTKKGTITTSAEGEKGMIHIKVTDTGNGIPLANQNLLFLKFQQAGGSTITRDGAKGTGLGLYISRLMAEGMGGTLDLIQSIEGKGSVFCLTLPINNKKT